MSQPAKDSLDDIVQAMANEPGRYRVRSRSQIGEHMVDLRNFDYAGECTCADWEVRVGAHLRRGETPQKPCCYHITMARKKFIRDNYDTDELSRRLVKAVLSTR